MPKKKFIVSSKNELIHVYFSKVLQKIYMSFAANIKANVNNK